MASKNIFIGVVALLIIGGGYMAYAKRGAAPQSDRDLQPREETNLKQDGEDNKQSMRDLVTMNEPVRCTFTHSTDISDSSGEVFIADGKLRGNFIVQTKEVANMSFESYMVTDNTHAYSWSSAMPQGFKVPLAQNSSQENGQQNGVGYDDKLNYECEPWDVDASLFTPPSHITFISIAQ